MAISANDEGFESGDTRVFEILRIHVPKNDKQAWLSAEMGSWEPWLAKQSGFLGRQLFWDPKNQEATLLIKWASRDEWKAIPKADLDKVQEQFEKLAREATGWTRGNPFPLQYESELMLQ